MQKENLSRSECALSASQHSPYLYNTLPSHPFSLSEERTPRQKQMREVKKNTLTAQVSSAYANSRQYKSHSNTINESENNLQNAQTLTKTFTPKETTVQTCNNTTLSLKSCEVTNTNNIINRNEVGEGTSITYNNNIYDKHNTEGTPHTNALPLCNNVNNNHNANLYTEKDNAISPYSKMATKTNRLPILQNLYNSCHNSNCSSGAISVNATLSSSLPINKLTQHSERRLKRQPPTSLSLTPSQNVMTELMQKTNTTSKTAVMGKEKCTSGDSKGYNNTIRYKTDLNKQVIHFMFHQLPHVHELLDDEADNVSSSTTNKNGIYTNDNNTTTNINDNNNWHMYWMSVGHVHNIFAGTEYRLNEVQIINHFPNHSELTRKDLMYKNIKAYLRAQESTLNDKQSREPLYVVNALSWRVSALLAQCDGHERSRLINLLHNKWKLYKDCAELQKMYNNNHNNNNNNNNNGCTANEVNDANTAFIDDDYDTSNNNNLLNVSEDEYRIFSFAESVPITYNIPNDINMFIEEFKRHPRSIWIVKPTSRCQGQGIFLINRIRQLMKWMRYKEKVNASLDSISECASMTRDDKQMSAVYSRTPEKGTTGKKARRTKCSSKSKRHYHKTLNKNNNKTDNNKKSVNSTHEAKQVTHKDREQNNDDRTSDCKWTHDDINKNEKAENNILRATGNNLTESNASVHSKVDHGVYSGTFIVSKYIHKPLLIGNKKFDLRLYVLVTSFNPLVAYLHEDGFARFCATPYSPHSLRDSDLASHLTNVALQKGEENYNAEHGGKLNWQNVLLYIHGHYGEYVAQGLVHNVEFLIYHSLRAVAKVMHNDKHCFELYGYDILLDDQVQPHLIEVNASPSLSTTTDADRWLKQKVLSDTLRIVVPPNYPANDSMPYAEYRLRTDLTTQLLTGFKLLQM